MKTHVTKSTNKPSPNATSALSTSPPLSNRRVGTCRHKSAKRSRSPKGASSCEDRPPNAARPNALTTSSTTSPNIPLAIVEAKDNTHGVGDGMQQALRYGEMLGVPFIFTSNGDGFIFHDRTGNAAIPEQELTLEQFPSPDELWRRYKTWKGLEDTEVERVAVQPYYNDGSGRAPRYYQVKAINRTVEAIAKGQDRILLVMATGTGKTYTAFQIIWRLWKSGTKKRILFLADRNILVDQAKTNDFKPFGGAMTKISNRTVDKSYEIYLSLYQAVTGNEVDADIYTQFSPDFFDLIVIDECHRGSTKENSNWRRILEYFSGATQIGLTATPKETADVSNIHYFGEPVYTYSLKEGINDGFLAPYKVVRIDIDKDLTGWRPEAGQRDSYGVEIEDRILQPDGLRPQPRLRASHPPRRQEGLGLPQTD